MKTSYAVMIGALMTMGLTGLARTGSAEPSEPLTVRLHLQNRAQISRSVVIRAEQEVSRIYRSFGVNTLWVEGGAPSLDLRSDIQLTVIISQAVDQRASVAYVMGSAPGSRQGQGRIAFAFYDRVERFAREYDVDAAVVLGHVIAHEIGHLLLPFGMHSKTGVMCARWESPQARNAVRGLLRFTSEQAELIRIKLRAMRTETSTVAPIAVRRRS